MDHEPADPELFDKDGYYIPQNALEELCLDVSDVWAERLGRGEPDPVPFGDYEITGELGHGGYGVVFEARDRVLGRRVALKVWQLAVDDVEEAVLHEARCLAQVEHANVVRVYATGSVGELFYIAMELVLGTTASDLREQGAHWRRTLAVYLHAGEGLAAVHRAQLVHGDFKPGNVLIGEDEEIVKVADFGIARMRRASETESGAEQPGSKNSPPGIGTPAYIAPERLEGRRRDVRSDQFSFCVALWEMLYGCRPFPGERVEEMFAAIARGELVIQHRPSGAPVEIETVLRRGLEADPERRYESMELLLGELRAALETPAVEPRPTRRRPRLRGWGLAALALLLSGAATLAIIGVVSPDEALDLAGSSSDESRALPPAKQAKLLAERGEFRDAHSQLETVAEILRADGWTSISNEDRIELVALSKDVGDIFKDEGLTSKAAAAYMLSHDILKKNGEPTSKIETALIELMQSDD